MVKKIRTFLENFEAQIGQKLTNFRLDQFFLFSYKNNSVFILKIASF